MPTRVIPATHAVPTLWNATCATNVYVGVVVPGPVAQPLTAYVAGVASTQVTNVKLHGVGDLTSTNGAVTIALSDVAETRHVDVYKEAAKSNLICSGTGADGIITLAANTGGGFGAYGEVTVAYTGAEDSTVTVYDSTAQAFIDWLVLCPTSATAGTFVATVGPTTALIQQLITGSIAVSGGSYLYPLGGYPLDAGQTLNVIFQQGGAATAGGWSESPIS